MLIGELSLDGAVRHVSGVLPLARLARERRIRRLYVPADDAPEAALIPDVEVYPIGSLAELINHLLGSAPLQPLQPTVPLDEELSPLDYKADFSLIRGQEHAKRALEVAASGGHAEALQVPAGDGWGEGQVSEPYTPWAPRLWTLDFDHSHFPTS